MKQQSVDYRAGRAASDAAAMAEIFNYYVETSPVIFSNTVLTPEAMREKLDRLGAGSNYPFIVAAEEGRVVGYAYAHAWMPDPVYGRCLETTIYLHRDCRGKGIGTGLLKRLVEACRRQTDAHVLVAMITGGNAASIHMAEKAGFRHVGTIHESGYKFGRYYDDLLYELLL